MEVCIIFSLNISEIKSYHGKLFTLFFQPDNKAAAVQPPPKTDDNDNADNDNADNGNVDNDQTVTDTASPAGKKDEKEGGARSNQKLSTKKKKLVQAKEASASAEDERIVSV